MKKWCKLFVLVIGMLNGGVYGYPVTSESDPLTARFIMDIERVATRCNIHAAQPLSDIIVHRDDGSILNTYQSDLNGHVDIPWSVESAHVSVITQTQSHNPFLPMKDIYTLLAATAGDQGVYRLQDPSLNGGCDCQQVHFDIGEFNAEYRVYFEHEFVDTRTPFNPISSLLCKQDGRYPSVNITALPTDAEEVAYTANIDINNLDVSRRILLTSDLWTGSENSGVALQYQLTDTASIITSHAETASGENVTVSWLTSTVQLFPAMFENHVLTATHEYHFDKSALGHMQYRGEASQAAFDASALYVLAPPSNAKQMRDEVLNLLSRKPYDFSFSQETQQLRLEMQTEDRINWHVLGPLTGVLPELALPVNIYGARCGGISILTEGYQSVSDLQALRAEWSRASRNGNALDPKKLGHYTQEIIEINY